MIFITIYAFALSIVAIGLSLWSASRQKDRSARDAIQKLGKLLGHSRITFYDGLGQALVHRSREEIREYHKRMIRSKRKSREMELIILLLDHLKLRVVRQDGEVIVPVSSAKNKK